MLPRKQTKEQREQARQTRAERKSQKLADVTATVDALLADTDSLPGYALAHVQKAREGKVGSLIALKCLDCCNWQKREVALCRSSRAPCTRCGLTERRLRTATQEATTEHSPRLGKLHHQELADTTPVRGTSRTADPAKAKATRCRRWRDPRTVTGVSGRTPVAETTKCPAPVLQGPAQYCLAHRQDVTG